MQKVSSSVINSISASQIQRSGAAFGDVLTFDGVSLSWRPTAASLTKKVTLDYSKTGTLIADLGEGKTGWLSLRAEMLNPLGQLNPWLSYYDFVPSKVSLILAATQTVMKHTIGDAIPLTSQLYTNTTFRSRLQLIGSSYYAFVSDFDTGNNNTRVECVEITLNSNDDVYISKQGSGGAGTLKIFLNHTL